MEAIPNMIHESWHQHLQPLFDNPKMLLIKDEILPTQKFYPESANIFRVFSMPLHEIKVVILGQDPYPNGEANGLAFAVNANFNKPASMRIIEKEIVTSMQKGFDWSLDRTLNRWWNQGVFLLNTALTVEAGNAGSHLGYWEWFTREVVKIIADKVKPIWLLWGTKAYTFRSFIYPFLEVNELNEEDVLRTYQNMQSESNFILTAPHPAAECYGGKLKFTGCNHFNLTNRILSIRGQKIVNW